MNEIKNLKKRYETFKISNPKIRIRAAAKQLNVTEMQLLETQLNEGVVRLNGDWTEMITDFHKMGEVMALTRNDFAVHERKGVYNNVSFFKGHKMGIVVGEDIDLRLFMNEWEYAFAVKKEIKGKKLYSFQFFDQYGDAVHKVYTTPKSELNGYYNLLEKYKSNNQTGITKLIERMNYAPQEIPDKFIDTINFQKDWLALKDTHDFFSLVKKYKLSRLQALRLAPKGYVFKVDNKAIENILEDASEQQIPIMIFVHNKGCIQIHTGNIKKIFKLKDWFNIMDPMFNLHLDRSGISESWIVKKPTKDGIVTSIELFDNQGELLMYGFGKRKPGIPELQSWKSIIEKNRKEFLV